MSKTRAMPKNPPKNFELTAQLRWHLENCGSIPLAVAKATGIHSSTLYRFLGEQRGLSDDAMNKLARHLKLRLIRA